MKKDIKINLIKLLEENGGKFSFFPEWTLIGTGKGKLTSIK